ncbi:MAG TPA: NAD(P)H-dependent oxidoreductase [Polyangiaceae bacterium]|jgi:chromate reductase|nr:NAD(P)H-dependent oxidoreductase [Polyangiaceae bacterium]
MTDVRVLAISGSLRKASYNTALLRAAIEGKPAGVEIELADIGALPLYDDDVYARGFPDPVAHLREQCTKADAFLMATPEYNYSIPGVLKNAIDWVSRPPSQPFAGKVLGIVGATPFGGGTARAQVHLRQIAVYLDLHVLNKPEVLVRQCKEHFDADLQLTDETTKKLLAKLLEAMAKMSRALRG